MTTPNAGNLYLGAGEVFFDRFDSAGASTGLRHLGNVSAFTSNVTADTVTKKSSMSGARGTLAEVVTGTTAEINLTLDEYESNNLALALLGTEGALLQTASTPTDQNINGGVLMNLDVWYDLGGFNPTVTTVKQSSTALNAAAYEVRADAGMIRLLSSYTGVGKASAAITTWTGTIPALVATDNKRIVNALSVGKVQGRLRYVSAADQANGPRVLVDVWKINLNPDGDLPLIGEDFGEFKLKGTAQQDLTKATGQQYIRVIYL